MPFHIQCYTKQLQASSSFAAHANILTDAKDAAAAAAGGGAPRGWQTSQDLKKVLFQKI